MFGFLWIWVRVRSRTGCMICSSWCYLRILVRIPNINSCKVKVLVCANIIKKNMARSLISVLVNVLFKIFSVRMVRLFYWTIRLWFKYSFLALWNFKFLWYLLHEWTDKIHALICEDSFKRQMNRPKPTNKSRNTLGVSVAAVFWRAIAIEYLVRS